MTKPPTKPNPGKPRTQREEGRLKTRAAILDATEELMREEGYAAVSARSVAERAGLKSQLVHYHFNTMDELFREAYRRNRQRHYSRHLKAVGSDRPLEELWKICTSREGIDLVGEYVSAANHRKVLQDDLLDTWNFFRNLQTTMISRYFADHRMDPGELTPPVLSFLIWAVAKTLAEEAERGFTEGHDEVIAFMTQLLGQLTPPGPDAPRARKPSAAKPAKGAAAKPAAAAPK